MKRRVGPRHKAGRWNRPLYCVRVGRGETIFTRYPHFVYRSIGEDERITLHSIRAPYHT